VPFGLAAIKGIKGLLGASNLPKNGIQGVNDVLGDTQKTITKAGNCFVAGTEILTVDGIKNIEDIVVGDWVIADDPTTPGGIEAKQVLETFVRETDALVDLYVDGEVISTTGEHPFWVPDKGWVEAKDLVVGSLLQTEDGRIVDVDGVERREGKFEVYNFNVEGIPTYFVSDLGILVHNADCGLSQDANNAIRRFENIKSNVLGDINSQANHNHYSAARREAAGEVVARRPDGTPFDHIGELQDTYRGLQNIRETLQRERNRLPDTLTDRGLDVLLKRYKEVQNELTRLKNFLTEIGHPPQ